MRHRLSIGYSTAAALSTSENNWKEKLRRIGLFLCALALLGLFFHYVTRSVGRSVSPRGDGEVGWNLTTQ
jgi:hypothetical protein